MSGSSLKPAAELARANTARAPNESAEYRRAREQLLAEEIELRRHAERVAELRRALPPGGAVTKNYEFVGEGGNATLSDLFGNKQTLVIYSYMFGPQREKPCPMCTSFMSTWEAKLPDIEQRIAIVFVARSPIARLIEAKQARGWTRPRARPLDVISVVWLVVLLAFALSLDNLVVGIGLGLLHAPLVVAALFMGLCSLVLTVIGLELGRQLGTRVGERSEVFSGIVLIAAGLFVLFRGG